MKNTTTQQTDSLGTVIKRLSKKDSERKSKIPVHLPSWPEGKRGAPNSFIRSALFAAIRGQDRQYMDRQILASQDGITVKFTGKQLNQTDLDVWEAVVNKAREQPLGTYCIITAHELLKSMGLPTGNSQHQHLHATVIRLTACAVEIEHDGGIYFGSLIKSGAKDKVTKHYGIEINKDLAKLFGKNKWTALDWEQRKQLRAHPLAQSLHALYSSHKKPFPLKLETLQAYTGTRNKEIQGFKRHVQKALTKLVKIGFLSSYKIEENMVHVQKISSSSQVSSETLVGSLWVT